LFYGDEELLDPDPATKLDLSKIQVAPASGRRLLLSELEYGSYLRVKDPLNLHLMASENE
jgi:hypothetical protein